MANTYKALQTITVGAGGTASVTFTNIPQNYTDLVITTSARSTLGQPNLLVVFNGANSTLRDITAFAVGTSTTGSNAFYQGIRTTFNDSSSTANTFTNTTVYITNYASNTAVKSVSSDSVAEDNGTTYNSLYMTGGLYSSTTPITSITLIPDEAPNPNTGINIAQHSTFTLYGVFNADVSSAPSIPTIGTATAGAGSASITFTGVNNAASYIMTSNPGSITGTGTTSPIVVEGLSGGTSYTFTARAQNPLGISGASAASNSVTPTNIGYESLATSVVGAGGTTNIDFGSISSTYTHLQLRLFVQEPIDTVALQFNSDTGNNYAWHSLISENGSTRTSSATTSTNMIFAATTYGTSGSNFAVAIIDILDYANTNKFKTVRSMTGSHNNTSFSRVGIYSGLWQSTSAISSIRVRSRTSGTFAQFSHVALYGIRG